MSHGLVRICPVTLLEVGYSARSAAELRDLLTRPLLAAMLVELMTPTIANRAIAVQQRLGDRGQHRAPSIPDLLIAATAGQPTEWLVLADGT